MEDNLVNNEHKFEYIACEIHANYTNKFSNPTYSEELPEELQRLGISYDLWYQFIIEANEQVKFQWWPNIIFWSFLCGIPIFCYNQHHKVVSEKMEKLCEKWNKSGTLPDGLSLRYDLRIKKFYIGGGEVTRLTELDTWHNIIFMASN